MPFILPLFCRFTGRCGHRPLRLRIFIHRNDYWDNPFMRKKGRDENEQSSSEQPGSRDRLSGLWSREHEVFSVAWLMITNLVFYVLFCLEWKEKTVSKKFYEPERDGILSSFWCGGRRQAVAFQGRQVKKCRNDALSGEARYLKSCYMARSRRE